MTTATKGLAAELKESTAKAHSDAEHSSFMSDLIEGRLDAEAFIRLQEQAWLIYNALEEAADVVRAEGFATDILDPLLNRSEILAQDINNFHGDDQWQNDLIASPAVRDYVTRLNQIRDEANGPALVAHHYVRYLGDLSGGQIIARMMGRHYGVEEESLQFYSFKGIDKLKVYKDNYRKNLDDLLLSADEVDQMLEEASAAFTYNQRVLRSCLERSGFSPMREALVAG
ncbi:Heme oxygenase [Corynebacterium pseudotuberculosis]|uniref:biliverdin-producing heme oxygenase n=1 Tax=Corynebacterium pseudotuberculosis TaxID=1719 RepID=UPI000C1CCB21|nr:biliverdin-producing heme oxygenase [Corynebacterium pseudotuberculosis]ATV79590.1 Heme oxygenase [Corynebacterium pseudotuberculosis]